MKYEEFITETMQVLSQVLGEEYEIQRNVTLKNNSVEYIGLLIYKDDERSVSPNIYLSTYYQQYLDGIPLTTIVEQILDLYFNSMMQQHLPEVESLEWEDCKDQIIYRLVNFETNQKMLEESPYIPFMDLAITFHYLNDKSDDGIQTMRIDRKSVV